MRKTSNSYYPIVFKIKNHTDQFEIAVDILNPVFRSQIFFSINTNNFFPRRTDRNARLCASSRINSGNKYNGIHIIPPYYGVPILISFYIAEFIKFHKRRCDKKGNEQAVM